MTDPNPRPSSTRRIRREAILIKYARLSKNKLPVVCGTRVRLVIFDTLEDAKRAAAELYRLERRVYTPKACRQSRTGHHHLIAEHE